MDSKRIILKLLAMNYRLIRELGYELNMPILVITDDNVDKLFRSLNISEYSYLISERMSRDHYNMLMVDETPGLLGLQYAEYDSVRGFIKALIRDMQAGMVEAGKVNKVPIVVTKMIPYKLDTEDLFIMSIPKLEHNDDIVGFEYIKDKDIELVKDKISKVIQDSMSDVEKVIKAACCFAFPILEDGPFEQLLSETDSIVEYDHDNKNLNSIQEIFQSCIYDWREDVNFNDIHQLPKLEMDLVSRINEILCFDDQYLYMKDTLFEKIIKYHMKSYGTDTIKRALVEEGVLLADNAATNTYTSKMQYLDIFGQVRRIRMLRFDIDKISRAADVDFITLCTNTKNGGN